MINFNEEEISKIHLGEYLINLGSTLLGETSDSLNKRKNYDVDTSSFDKNVEKISEAIFRITEDNIKKKSFHEYSKEDIVSLLSSQLDKMIENDEIEITLEQIKKVIENDLTNEEKNMMVNSLDWIDYVKRTEQYHAVFKKELKHFS